VIRVVVNIELFTRGQYCYHKLKARFPWRDTFTLYSS